MSNPSKEKEFLSIYKDLCEEYGMFVGAGCDEVGEIGSCIETEWTISPTAISEHLKELEESLPDD